MATDETDTEAAAEHLEQFFERTGVSSPRDPERYLWTDAYAVCTAIGLARTTGEDRYAERARDLVDQVHRTLGRHRPDDERTGWLSGLSGDRAERHPTAGGLRIGKELPERAPGEPTDRRDEWNRDGQYFHYNTKWMHALDVLARRSRRSDYNRWARELADVSHDGFVYTPSGSDRPMMYWKTSIDLSRPLVESMGQHNPVDGYTTFRQLRESAEQLGDTSGPNLDEEIETFERMLRPERWSTSDPLGLGGLLFDAIREAQLLRRGRTDDPSPLGKLLAAADRGLDRFAADFRPDESAARRLAFRELGLALGLAAVDRMRNWSGGNSSVFPAGSDRTDHLDSLAAHAELRRKIVSFWRRDPHQKTQSWREHRNINQVMLAAALAPEGCLHLPKLAD